MIKTEVGKLTPKLAQELLNNNSLNRPVSIATLERYEKAIKRGEWQLNGEPIIVFTNGDLGDGQHRCMAVARTGIAIDAVFIYGVEPNAFETINTGKARSASDVLSIGGEINTIKLASAARAYLMESLPGRDAYCITSTQIKKCVENHPHLRYWVQRFTGANKVKETFSAFICAYFAIASEKYGFEKMDVFFNQLATGVGLLQGSPALALRERFMSQTKTTKIPTIHAKAFIIKSINAHLMDKKMSILKFAENEAMPKII